MLKLIKTHIEEISGVITGSGTGIYLSKIDVVQDMHTLVMAFLTGIVGGFAAWLIKRVLNKNNK